MLLLQISFLISSILGCELVRCVTLSAQQVFGSGMVPLKDYCSRPCGRLTGLKSPRYFLMNLPIVCVYHGDLIWAGESTGFLFAVSTRTKKNFNQKETVNQIVLTIE